MAASKSTYAEHQKALVAAEIGTLHKASSRRLALVYPSPYRAAMSSLGYQAIYRLTHEHTAWTADRATLPDSAYRHQPATTLETGRHLGEYPLLAFSVAYELELAGMIEVLERSKIPSLRDQRSEDDPLIVAGGPLTFSNPAPLGPFADVVLLGEAEDIWLALLERLENADTPREQLLSWCAQTPGFYVPSVHGEDVPQIASASSSRLPARSQIITPNTELRSMFLTEAARGCSRGCTYCVMRRSTNGGMRIVEPDRIIAGVPEAARRVGLVGAAVTDHPRIHEVVKRLVDSGREVGISSLRADKLDDDFVELLARGGYRTLTVALDAATQTLRDAIERKTKEKHILNCARLANTYKLRTLKLYMMLGIPGECDDDIDELARFLAEVVKVHPRVALGIAPFVAKRHTPLDGAPFAGVKTVQARLKKLRKLVRGRVEIRPTSARWAWVEYMLAQGTQAAGLAVYDAWRAGSSYADYRNAFEAHKCQPTGPRSRVLSTAETIRMHRAKRSQSLPIAASQS